MKNITLIIEVDETLNVTDVDGNGDYILGNDVAQTIVDMGGEWPGHIMPTTQAVSGRKIIQVKLETVSDDPVALIEALIINYSLNWIILGCMDLNEPYIDSGQVDADGNPIMQSQVYLAVKPKALTYQVIETGTATVKNLHIIAGQVNWI